LLAQEAARRLGHNIKLVGIQQIFFLVFYGKGPGAVFKVSKSVGVKTKCTLEVALFEIGRRSGFVGVRIPFTLHECTS
ncbi:hypothetical protein JKP88DRAFT_163350, partial [Tribonema minus]